MRDLINGELEQVGGGLTDPFKMPKPIDLPPPTIPPCIPDPPGFPMGPLL